MLRLTLLAFAALLLGADAQAPRLSRKEYKEKAKNYRNSHSKDDFVNNIDKGMSKVRANRAWAYFQEQLDDGRVIFDGDNSVHFVMPPSHAFSTATDMIHPAIADTVETAFRVVRALHFGTLKAMPSKVQETHDDLFHWAFTSAYIKYAVFGVMGLFFAQMLFTRFTCGMTEEQKKLVRIYDDMKAKKQI